MSTPLNKKKILKLFPMMPNDNMDQVRQQQMVVAWIRLRKMKKLKETKPNGQLTS